MSRGHWQAAFFILCAFAAPCAHAQEPSSAAAHFQAYEAALQRGDVAAAEVAASQALAASEQQSGDGGRTAVLAFNLARVRVSLGQWQQASAPAERAYLLARNQGAAGLDPLMTRLLWGRVRLGTEGLGASDFVSAALDDAEDREDLLQDRYDAADQLGMAATAARRHIIARRAWAFAAEASAGAPYDAQFARGRARAYEGIAISLQTLARDVLPRPLLIREARERFTEAHSLLQPFAFLGAEDGSLTAPQELYAQVLAWDATLQSLLILGNSPGSNQSLADNPASPGGAPLCGIAGEVGGLTFPATMRFQGQLGSVVVRLRFDSSGAYQGTDIASAVGDESFEQSVLGASVPWTFERTPNAPAGCTMSPVLFLTVPFNYFREP